MKSLSFSSFYLNTGTNLIEDGLIFLPAGSLGSFLKYIVLIYARADRLPGLVENLTSFPALWQPDVDGKFVAFT